MTTVEWSEMRMGDAGASMAVSLAAYGVMAGMSAFEAVEAARQVLVDACEQHDKARGRKVTRMMGEVPVLEVMVAMGEVIEARPGAGPLRKAFDQTAQFDDDPPGGIYPSDEEPEGPPVEKPGKGPR